jgi:hypothetical protein
MTTLPPSCAECLEIWEPQPPGTLWAFQACNGIAHHTTRSHLVGHFYAICTHKVLVAIGKRLTLEGHIEIVTVHEYSGKTGAEPSKHFNNNKIQKEMHLLVHIVRFEDYWMPKN